MPVELAPARPVRGLKLVGVSLLALTLAEAAHAQAPRGGVVARGTARIVAGSDRTVIRQTTRRAVIDWRRFDVGRDHTVVFDQPGKTSATLNRVTTARPSVIEGAIRAPGTVVIQNGAGVLFSEGATVDTGGLVATSRGVNAARFQATGQVSLGGSAKGGSVANRGTITVGEAGLAALVGDEVENAGTIVARGGKVVLAGGTTATIDLAGDGLMTVAGAGSVVNSGAIDGADILLTAHEASSVLDAAINVSGVIRASGGDAGGSIAVRAGNGTARVGGALDASGTVRGGKVTVTGRRIDVTGDARISARGGADGGIVRLGGNRSGSGTLPRARELSIASGAEVNADGDTGSGGVIIAWSDGNSRIHGTLSALGGRSGGFIETSALAALQLGETAAVTSGTGGRWLLDPRNVIIGASGGVVPGGSVSPPAGNTPYTVSLVALRNALDAGTDVTVTTEQPASTMAGDITLNGALSWTGTGDLALSAERDILISAPVSTTAGDFTASAARSVSVAANVTATGTAAVSLSAGTGDIRLSRASAGDLSVTTAAGDLTLSAGNQVTLRNWNGGLDVRTGSGDLDISAGNMILARGGAGANQWVRVGSATSSGTVTLGARLIDVVGGIGSGSAAEVLAGTGGALDMRATDRILVQNWTGGSAARVASLGGASLILEAAKQCWFGYVQSGTGIADGGPVSIAGAIAVTVEPVFSLSGDQDFAFADKTADGQLSSYEGAPPLSVTTRGGGTIAIDAPVNVSNLALVSEAGVALGSNATLTTTDAGASLVVSAGSSFANESGADVFASGGRWLLYMDRFDSPSGTLPVPDDFDLYGRTLADSPPSSLGFPGNRIVYAEQPTLTLTADSSIRIYGEAAGPVGYTSTGLRSGDSFATALTGTPVVTAAGTAASSDAGTYASSVMATASAQGYRLVLVDGTLSVTPAPLTVTVDDASRVYGSANPQFGASYSGFVLGQDDGVLTGDLTFSTPATVRSGVGTYTVSGSGLTSGNYAISYLPGTLTVTPAALTVTADDATRRYGSSNPAFTATYAGLVAGDTAGDIGPLTFSTAATSTSDVGNYAITVAGLSSANYAVTYLPGTLAVTQAPLTVTARNATRRYGAVNPGFSATYTGLVAGDTTADLGPLALRTAATVGSDVGSYAITPSGLSNGNYAISYAPGTLTVTKAPLTITANDASRRYGSADPALGVRYKGFVAGDDASDLTGTLRVASGTDAGSNVGTYGISASGLSSGNYAISWRPGTLTIDPAPLTVTATDSRRTYGSAGSGYRATYDGFVNGDDTGDLAGSLHFDTTASQSSPVGSYGVTPAGYTNGNYAISYIAGYLTVDPAPLTITANDATRFEGETDPDFTARYDGFVLGEGTDVLEGSLEISSDADLDSAAGSYALTPGGLDSANYAITYVDGELTVLPAAQPAPSLLSGTGDRIVASRGVPPLTPGDASFRTTTTEAPPALDNPFALTYSLGELVQLGTPGAEPAPTATQGFVPASGGSKETQGFVPASGGSATAAGEDICEGSIRLADDAACGRSTTRENYWTSRTSL